MATAADTGLVVPGTSKGLLSIPKYHYLLWRLIRKAILIRYRGSILGWFWSFARPVAQFLIYFIAVGVFLRLGTTIGDYQVYLFSGIITVGFFTEVFSQTTQSIVANTDLVKKIYLPRELFPVSSVAVALINFIPQLLIITVVCLIVGWRPTPLNLLAGILAVVILAILGLGLGLLFGALNVSFRDSQNVVDIILMMALWASPVLYQASTMYGSLPDWVGVVYQLNPITSAVELMHYAFWAALESPKTGVVGFTIYTLIAVVTALIVLAIGQLVFRRLEGRFAQDL